MSEFSKNLLINDLLVPTEDCSLEQVSIVIFLDPKNDRAFLLGLTQRSKPKEYKYYEVLGWLVNGQITKGIFESSEFWKMPEQYVSAEELEKRDQKFQVIKLLISNLKEFLTSRSYGKGLVASCIKVATELGVNATRWQIYQWFYRYLQCGQNINAFLRKPGTGKSKSKTYALKTGPKRDEGRACNGRMRTPEDNKHFITILRKHVFCHSPKPLTEAFIEYQNTYVSDAVIDPFTGEISGYELRKNVKHLSEDQFKYFARQYLLANQVKLRESQHTTDEYNKNERGLSGNILEYFGDAPGSDYQIDETPLAIELVDEFDRNRRVGKPTCYSVIGMFSRSWVGLMLTFAKASAHTAREIVFIAFRNKEAFCKEIGVILNERWKQEGKGRRLIVDNAEFASALTDAFSQDAHVEVVFNKEGNSQEKGLVERRHLSLEEFLYGRVPGVERKYVQAFLKRRLRKDAVLNIRELYQILIDYITRFNNHYPLQTLPLSKEMRMDNVKKIPSMVWDWGLTERAGDLQMVDEHDLYMRLLENGQVTVKRDGLFLQGKYIRTLKKRRESKGLLYTCDWAYHQGLYEREIGKTYSCKFMRYSLSKIWIITKSGLQEAKLSTVDNCYEWWSAECIQDDKILETEEHKLLLQAYQHEQNKTKASANAVLKRAKQEQQLITVNAANSQDLSFNRDIAIAEEIKHSQRQLNTITSQNEVGHYRDWETDRKSTRLNSSHLKLSRMPSSA